MKYFKSKLGILYNDDTLKLLKTLPSEIIDTVITSPPYWGLRNYEIKGQLGLEDTFHEYLKKLWDIFDEIYRILKPTGTCWINLNDSYSYRTKGGKMSTTKSTLCNGRGINPKLKNTIFAQREKQKYSEKSLLLLPQRFAIGMVDRKWILRNDIIWEKPNAIPSSAKDRFTVNYEHIFFFVKQEKYYFKQQLEKSIWAKKDKRSITGPSYSKGKSEEGQYAMNTSGSYTRGKFRNKRCIWEINTKPFKGEHFAAFPPKIPEICIDAGCPKDGVVLDPFMGSGTTAIVAEKLGRKWIGIELNPKYCEMIKLRINAIPESLF